MKVYKLHEDCKNIIKCLTYPDKFEDEIKALENLANIEFKSASKVFWVTSYATSCRYAMVKFSIQDFDVGEVYDPNEWNEFPKIIPPFDIDMRVELDDGTRYCAKYHMFSDGCFWVHTNGTCMPKYMNDKVIYFRPWE